MKRTIVALIATLLLSVPIFAQNLTIDSGPPPYIHWWTDADELLLSQLITAEMGVGNDYEAMIAVGVVAINRAAFYPEFWGENLRSVIYAPGQYSCAPYLHSTVPNELAKQAAFDALSGNHDVPSDVIWQAGFTQSVWGTKVHIWKTFDTYPSKTYFCHYGI